MVRVIKLEGRKTKGTQALIYPDFINKRDGIWTI